MMDPNDPIEKLGQDLAEIIQPDYKTEEEEEEGDSPALSSNEKDGE